MKNIFGLLSLVVFCVSCSLDDNDYPNYHITTVAITSVDIPEVFNQGKTYEITVYYDRLSTCHYPNGIYYSTEPNNTRIIAAQNIVYHRSDCITEIDDEDLVQAMSFDFWVTQAAGSVYTFKFYQGVDESGKDSFLIVEVPVEEQIELIP